MLFITFAETEIFDILLEQRVRSNAEKVRTENAELEESEDVKKKSTEEIGTDLSGMP